MTNYKIREFYNYWTICLHLQKDQQKIPQRQDNAGAVCDSGIGIGCLLKSSIIAVEVKFCQGSIGAIRGSLATMYDVWRYCQTEARNYLTQIDSHTENRHTVTPALLAVPAKT